MRPIAGALLIGVMKGGNGQSELPRITADLVERDEAVIAVEGRVLQTLRHHRPGVLLKFHGKSCHLVAHRAARWRAREIGRDDGVNEIENLMPEPAPFLARPGRCPFDIPAILGRYPMRSHIGAIDGEAGDHRPQRPAQAVPRVVSAVPVPLRDAMKIGGEHAKLAAEHGIHHEILRIAQQLVEIGLPPDEPLIVAGRRRLLPRVDQEAVELADEIVTGGARHRPIRAQPFVPRQDLLDDDVSRCGLARVWRAQYSPGSNNPSM